MPQERRSRAFSAVNVLDIIHHVHSLSPNTSHLILDHTADVMTKQITAAHFLEPPTFRTCDYTEKSVLTASRSQKPIHALVINVRPICTHLTAVVYWLPAVQSPFLLFAPPPTLITAARLLQLLHPLIGPGHSMAGLGNSCDITYQQKESKANCIPYLTG